MSTTTTQSSQKLPTGTWQVVPAASRLQFASRGMWGLAKVRGTFSEYTGTLHVIDAQATGRLVIQSASLDSGNAKRDTHLRSDDFFGVEAHPTLTFDLSEVTLVPAGLQMAGVLSIRATELAVSGPLTVERSDAGGLRVRTELAVDRAAAGVGWSKLGMIRGDAQLLADLVLTAAD